MVVICVGFMYVDTPFTNLNTNKQNITNQPNQPHKDPAAHGALARLPPGGDFGLRRLRHRAAGTMGGWVCVSWFIYVRCFSVFPSRRPLTKRTNQTQTKQNQIRPIIQSTMVHVDRLDLLKALAELLRLAIPSTYVLARIVGCMGVPAFLSDGWLCWMMLPPLTHITPHHYPFPPPPMHMTHIFIYIPPVSPSPPYTHNHITTQAGVAPLLLHLLPLRPQPLWGAHALRGPVRACDRPMLCYPTHEAMLS